MDKIVIPQEIIDHLPTFANDIRAAFKLRISEPKLIGRVTIPANDDMAEREVFILVDEIFKGKKYPKKEGETPAESRRRQKLNRKLNEKTLAAYCHAADVIFVYRSILKETLGARGIEHYLAHEIAHAIDKESVKHSTSGTAKGVSQRFLDKYFCRKTEFEAEMAAIEAVEIPFIAENLPIIIAQYLNCVSGYVGGWGRDKKYSKIFVTRLKAALEKHNLF